ncbi:MAG TPA: energy-coupling factor ABC transporter permease [Candidatus Limnocylindrales bacterium]|jgi:cobalt/nickel transport system permease protein
MSAFTKGSIGVGDGVEALHAPDGFLSFPMAAVMWLITLLVLAYAVRQTNRTLDDRAIPLMGVMAAFIFAAQMFNFQVIGGTSGHLLGGVLAAVLLGPWAGTLVMACVIAVQGLVFQDGGLVVMGANIFNMGIIGTLGGYACYRALCRLFGGEQRARIPAAGIAAWAAVVVASLAAAVELALSGTTDLSLALLAMGGVHGVIGIGEALITMAALGFIQATRPDLFALRDARTRLGSTAPAAAAA